MLVSSTCGTVCLVMLCMLHLLTYLIRLNNFWINQVFMIAMPEFNEPEAEV